ncbi:hypothetical protein D9M70_629770 [compost metagenome]
MEVVEAVHFQGGGNGLDINFCCGDLGLVGPAHELRHHDGPQHADDHDHHHDFDQGKTALPAARVAA